MAENTPKRKIKDSVFTNLFQDRKYLLQLYKALHPEDCSVTEDAIADVTIKHVLVDADYPRNFLTGQRLPLMQKLKFYIKKVRKILSGSI